MTEHFLSTLDWSAQRLDAVLAAAAALKAGRDRRRLDGRVMALLFFDPSLRTRTSCEVAMFQLGGHAVTLTVGQGVWGMETADGVVMDGAAAEHVREAAPVLSRYADALGVRAFPHGASLDGQRADPVLAAFARFAEVPVINLESARWHPCQALADAMTSGRARAREGGPGGPHLGLPPQGAAHGGAELGGGGRRPARTRPDRAAARPLRPRPAADQPGAGGRRDHRRFGGRDRRPRRAWTGRGAVYAKSWGSLLATDDAAREAELRAPFRHWRVTPAWMARTDRGRFMHCLPVRRNVVVTTRSSTRRRAWWWTRRRTASTPRRR